MVPVRELQLRQVAGDRTRITIIERDPQTDRIAAAVRLTRPTTEVLREVEKWEQRGYTLTQINGEYVND